MNYNGGVILFFNKYRFIAHRGLHSRKFNIPENSIPAFLKSVSKNYAIELDIQMSSDGEIVVFHDKDLERMTGVRGRVSDFTLPELKGFMLSNSNCEIPTLSEVLRLVGGRVPILIELKNNRFLGKMEKKLIQILEGYRGDYAIQSFNPLVLLWFRFYASYIKRGQIVSRNNIFLLNKILLKYTIKPDFISCRYNEVNYDLYKKCKNIGIPLICWTIKTIKDLEKLKIFCNAFIFEDIGEFIKCIK